MKRRRLQNVRNFVDYRERWEILLSERQYSEAFAVMVADPKCTFDFGYVRERIKSGYDVHLPYSYAGTKLYLPSWKICGTVLVALTELNHLAHVWRWFVIKGTLADVASQFIAEAALAAERIGVIASRLAKAHEFESNENNESLKPGINAERERLRVMIDAARESQHTARRSHEVLAAAALSGGEADMVHEAEARMRSLAAATAQLLAELPDLDYFG